MKSLKGLVKSRLFKGSFIVFLGNGIGSFFNYLYHLTSGRLLLPSQYGLLQSFVVLAYFFAVFTGAFSFAVINLVSKVKETFVFTAIRELEKKALKMAFAFWVIFLVLFPFFKNFLHLKNFWVFFIFSLQVVFLFLSTVYSSVLRAKLKFFEFSAIGVLSSFAKIVFSLIFILIGWQVMGALGGLIIAGVVAALLGWFWVRRYWQKSLSLSEKIEQERNFGQYLLLSLITNLALTSIYSTDILLVRHFFSPYLSGIYSATSVLGKIIFFAATSVLSVAFPLFTRFKDNSVKLRQTSWLSFFFLVTICLLGITSFKSFPDLIVSLLYGKEYKEAALFLPSFAVFISLFALLNLLVQFLLAQEEKAAAWLGGSSAVVQIFLILALHDNLKTIINNSIISVCLGLFLGLLILVKTINGQRE